MAWSHVYLGCIHDIEDDERDLALDEYRAALATNGSPDAALRAAAQKEGVKSAYQPVRFPMTTVRKSPGVTYPKTGRKNK